MNSVFTDSSFFKAIADKEDDFHDQALDIYRKLIQEKALLVTTNFILDETFTLIRIKVNLQKALEFRESLVDMRNVLKIVRVLVRDEAEVWKWFPKNWSKLSFTDCTSFAVMERLGLKEVATFDRHFAKAGFKVLA